ncbi:MAG: hypothetical protein K2O09_10175, partial [Treponemataceae bacterium]|nr:hypothetical protein [Treponemataceae bacterium]
MIFGFGLNIPRKPAESKFCRQECVTAKMPPRTRVLPCSQCSVSKAKPCAHPLLFFFKIVYKIRHAQKHNAFHPGRFLFERM